ncbi:zonula occludens toxin [Acinetobacter junii]|uniref:zonular occludens toxin domain-containing protein n=1 Tax=Acinetobacter junii TaxID=40215 RepID=UPI000B3CB1EC|nr:zonular occludens toxin domain-containing protein [Acinetobacter junii]AWA47939.1 zonula occludens toxin [Acinetobacter junii]AWA47952.1 zonula occludens toxin [Acinetobacter junii]AWA47965.1 zonula occludens toxin [Acinetobacter junii]AWA47978.1 zonula occludens toxin [Acinetobacter junii]QEE13970.1 zonula occludens toxin [Acinetobacter junii]
MLHLITGTPGAGKTLYAVSLIVKYEDANERALIYNSAALKHNKELIEKHNLADYFASYTYFSKKTKEQETVLFEPDHFDYFNDQLRTENIFLDIQFYNGICKIIKNDLDIDLKTLKDVRHIYANIDGLKVPNVRPIEIDWRKCPDGSIIFYDEIQLIYEYSTDNKQDKESIVKELTIHRHRAFDIYGITQFPSLVHTNYRAVVGLHYHLHRGWGAPSATVYVWANCRDKPNSLGNKLTAERDFRFNYPKRLYQYYESATANTVKLRVPLKLFAILIIPLLGLFMVGNMLFGGGNNFLGTIFGSKEKTEQVTKNETPSNPSVNNSSSNLSPSSDQKAMDLSLECRKAVNLEKPECVKWFDDLSKNKSSVTSTGQVVQTISYNPNKPYDFEYQPQVQPTDFPRMSGVIKLSSGKLVAIDQQGNYMQNISQADCKRWLDGYRPFNYFSNNRSDMSSTEMQRSEISTHTNQPKI